MSTAERRQARGARGREVLRTGRVRPVHSPLGGEEPEGREVPGTTEARGRPGHPRVNPTWLPSRHRPSTEFRASANLEKPHLYAPEPLPRCGAPHCEGQAVVPPTVKARPGPGGPQQEAPGMSPPRHPGAPRLPLGPHEPTGRRARLSQQTRLLSRGSACCRCDPSAL